MRYFIIYVLILIPFLGFGQFRTNERGDVIPFSVGNPQVDSLKNAELINTLYLPEFDNDSLFWLLNAEQIILRSRPSGYNSLINCVGISMDTSFNFFERASKIQILEGYLWILKIYSPTATGYTVYIRKYQVSKYEYLTSYSDMLDSVPSPYELQEYDVLTSEMNPRFYKRNNADVDSVMDINYLGKHFYLEYFTKEENPKNPVLIIDDIFYQFYPENGNKKLPVWLTQKYPFFDFSERRFKEGFSFEDFERSRHSAKD